ncbi:putative non-specific serine/threonine protein kinase [Helianthus annuus]|uniref:Non-specific serine/threonine protein kinase n=1 Tax=Helianthus annuus TaxID=4232 RepID=A0A9K3J4E1_HELAN|nr:putative non-specific serine/threonine protein kinase [Helianthus annuus]
MSNLVHLNLDSNIFNIDDMRFIAAFPSLRFLSLERCFIEVGRLFANGVPNLPYLEVLLLSTNNFNETLPMEAFTSFHRLEVLDLSNNNFFGTFTSFHRLEVLDLSNNNFFGSIPSNIKLLSSLKAVSFSKNKLNGSLPDHGICELKNLHELDLSANMFGGNLPECLKTLSSLRLFDISSNRFSGMLLPSLIANLTSLEYIDVSHNKFEGSFSFSSFSNHTKLEVVELTSDNDNFMVETEEPIGWTPMFQLVVLVLSNCNVNRAKGSVLPGFLVNQHKLQVLDISHNSIQGKLPNWLIKNNTMLELLNLRNNSFCHNFLMPFYRNPNIWWLDLSGNLMIGVIPKDIQKFLPYITNLNLSRNSLEGAIPCSIGDMWQLEKLDLSSNQLSGEVPTGLLTNLSELFVLKLSNNRLHGEVLSGNLSFGNIESIHLDSNYFSGKIQSAPNKTSTLSQLTVLDISNNLFTASLRFLDISENYFSGTIPPCLNLQIVEHLHMGSNLLTGSMPNSFRSMLSILTLDIGNNSLSGTIPEFLGELSDLRILQLRKNKFSGSIPKQLCQLTSVSLIDLSSNSLSGQIPPCLKNIARPTYQAFMETSYHSYHRNSFYNYRSILNKKFNIHDSDNLFETQDEITFTTKTLALFYKGGILNIMSGLDLSCNKLTGDIPKELGLLTHIRVLNLSHNVLTGPIPVSLSNLTDIESLDLSSNGLTGKVPVELIKLHSLAVFNVSYNNLSGKLPEMKEQFSTFTKESYEGNPLLCGPPLEYKCTTEPHETYQLNEEETYEKWHDVDMTSFYGSSSSTWLVFMFGFAILLYINPYWRKRWLDFVEECLYTCYYFFYYIGRKISMLFRK